VPTLPRELAPDEISRLWATAATEVRLAVALLLGGLSPDELLALRWDDVDLAGRELRVGGGQRRTVAMLPPAFELLERLPATPGTRVLAMHAATQPTLDDVTSDLLCAAHDAAIERPTEVTPGALRHTYIAFLARQGIRLADLAKVVGRLPPEQAAVYSSYSPPEKRLSLDEVNRVMEGIGEAGEKIQDAAKDAKK
jgi:succinoglycan biosynthesis transport protein ExoP